MPDTTLKSNHSGGEPYDIHLEAVPEDDDEDSGLMFEVNQNGETMVDVFETDPTAIREFRDLVVEQCDKAIEHIRGGN